MLMACDPLWGFSMLYERTWVSQTEELKAFCFRCLARIFDLPVMLSRSRVHVAAAALLSIVGYTIFQARRPSSGAWPTRASCKKVHAVGFVLVCRPNERINFPICTHPRKFHECSSCSNLSGKDRSKGMQP